jgi:hypothetical protein
MIYPEVKINYILARNRKVKVTYKVNYYENVYTYRKVEILKYTPMYSCPDSR